MDMVFRSPDPEGSLWHRRAMGRIRSAVRRLQAPSGRVSVQLEDIRGPGGGMDKRCRVEVAVPGEPPVAITAISRSWRESIEAAASALRRRMLTRRPPARPTATGDVSRGGRMRPAA